MSVLTSVENMTFNGVDLAEEFAGSDDSGQAYLIVNSVMGRGVVESENTYINSPGMDGAYPTYSRMKKRSIEVFLTLKGESFEDLRKRIERLNEILYTGNEEVPIQFADEPDRTYYGKVDKHEDVLERSRIYQARLTIVCSDPYKYGRERTLVFPEDISIVPNEGRAEALPIFELTAKEKTTFAMISLDDEEYNLIGEPADDDVEIVDTKTSVLYENGSTVDSWETATSEMVDSYFLKDITGEMGTDGAGIRADRYGSGDKLHGPAVYKEIDPIQDFEIETTFDIISRREVENFRIGILFHDENMNTIGHIGIKDNSRTYKRRVPLARYGPYRGGSRANGNLIGDSQKNDKARETTLFYLRAKREGSTLDFYIGEWQAQKHVRSWHETYRDTKNEYNGKLKYITLYVSTYADRVTPTRLRMNSVEVFELTQATVDQTPYILEKGDVVTFDHKNEDILVNGEPRMDLKNFGGSFFTLKKGDNRVVITPEGAFDAEVTFAERYR